MRRAVLDVRAGVGAENFEIDTGGAAGLSATVENGAEAGGIAGEKLAIDGFLIRVWGALDPCFGGGLSDGDDGGASDDCSTGIKGE